MFTAVKNHGDNHEMPIEDMMNTYCLDTFSMLLDRVCLLREYRQCIWNCNHMNVMHSNCIKNTSSSLDVSSSYRIEFKERIAFL